MKTIIKLSAWMLKWLIAAGLFLKVCRRETKIWISKRREKSIHQIEREFEQAVEEEVSRLSTPSEKIVIVNSVDEYLNKDELNPIIVIGDNYRIRRIDNEEGAIFFGKNRGWCTADTPGFYRNSYSKDYGELFIIYLLHKKRPEAQLFIRKSGGIRFKLKYNGHANWFEFKDQDQRLKDWWNIYYPNFLRSHPESIEVRSSGIITPSERGITTTDAATLSLLHGLGGYGGGAYGNGSALGGQSGGLFGGGLEAQQRVHADGAAMRQAVQAGQQADLVRCCAQTQSQLFESEARLGSQMNDQRIALNDARLGAIQSQLTGLLRSVDP